MLFRRSMDAVLSQFGGNLDAVQYLAILNVIRLSRLLGS